MANVVLYKYKPRGNKFYVTCTHCGNQEASVQARLDYTASLMVPEFHCDTCNTTEPMAGDTVTDVST